MGAITVRNLPDDVHGGLRRLAEARKVSVEALVRVVLAEVVRGERGETAVQGFGEAPMIWGAAGPVENAAPPMPEMASGELWGALKGSVYVPAETDLTAPVDASWQAER